MPGKLLMFAKLSLKSSIYDLTETFCFPQKQTADLYEKYSVEKVEISYILTDTDSTALKFIFISDPNSDLPEDKFRDTIFKVILTSKIQLLTKNQLKSTSHEFCDIFGARKESMRKKLH